MLNLIHFLIILILWGLIFLIIRHKETFKLHPFVPWGSTLQGCINRCQISSEQKLDKNYCEKTCNNCSSTDCIWKQTQNTVLDINKNKEKSKNKFEIQAIPGLVRNKNSVLVQWTYDKAENKKFSLYQQPQTNFNEYESFTLISNLYQETNYTYDKSKNSFTNKDNTNEIISLYQLIKNGIQISPKKNENGWFLSTDEGYLLLCSDPIHPLNSVSYKNNNYTQYKKQDKTVEKYILELINTDNLNAGIMIYEYEYELMENTIYTKTINDLNPNTNYKLVIYPLFKEDNINKELSEIITFSTNDNKFRVST